MICRRIHSPAGRGFTLVETLMSSGLLGIVLVAMGSAIVLSARAVPSPQQAGQGRIAAARAMEQITADFTHALFVLDRSATAATVVVRDRTGNGQSERIRYSWSGVAGEPLLRQVNDGEPRPVLDAVHELTFDYTHRQRSHTYPAPIVEDSSETYIAGTGSLLDLTAQAVTQSNWSGQYIVPSFSGDVIAWRPTRASFHANTRSAGPIWVQLMMADGNRHPTGTLLAHATANSGDFGDLLNLLAEERVTFETAERVPTGHAVALVIRNDGSDSGANVAYQLGSNRVRTTDAGASWSHSSTYTLVYGLWGVLTRQGDPLTTTFDHLSAVSVDLATENDPGAAVHSRVHLRNEPPLLADAWALDFERDPETVDLLGDGTDDWHLDEEETFGYIGDETEEDGDGSGGTGTWSPSDPLHTRPLNDFAGPTLVELRMRHAATGSDGAGFQIFANRLNGEAAELQLQLMKQSDGSQTLTLTNPGNSDETLIEAPNLGAGFVTLMLLIDPAHHTVHLKVNGRSHGTFPYQRRSVTTDERYAGLLGDSGAAEFDFVRIHVAD